MDRNPSNTAVFVFALYLCPGQAEYQDNLCRTIKMVQHLGFEPYVVSPNTILLNECNLFVQLDVPYYPLKASQPYWRDYNLLLVDHIKFDIRDMEIMLNCDQECALFCTSTLSSMGTFFQNSGRDWIEWHRQLTRKDKNNWMEHLVLFKRSQRIIFKWPFTTSSYRPPATTAPCTPHA